MITFKPLSVQKDSDSCGCGGGGNSTLDLVKGFQRQIFCVGLPTVSSHPKNVLENHLPFNSSGNDISYVLSVWGLKKMQD